MKWTQIKEDEWPEEPMLELADELWHHKRRGYWLALFVQSVNHGQKRMHWVLYSPDFNEIHNQYELAGFEVKGPPLTWAEICLKQ